MRVSAKSDYALRAVIELAASHDGEAINAEQLSRLQGIPHGFLQAILGDLRRDGILMSQRGQGGGWRLGRDATQITVADVIRSIDGPLVSVHGMRPEAVTYNDSAAALQSVWVAARSGLRSVLEHVTIRDLVTGELPASVAARVNDEGAWRAR